MLGLDNGGAVLVAGAPGAAPRGRVVTIKATRAFLLGGARVEPDTVLEVSAVGAAELLACNKARLFESPPQTEPEPAPPEPVETQAAPRRGRPRKG